MCCSMCGTDQIGDEYITLDVAASMVHRAGERDVRKDGKGETNYN